MSRFRWGMGCVAPWVRLEYGRIIMKTKGEKVFVVLFMLFVMIWAIAIVETSGLGWFHVAK